MLGTVAANTVCPREGCPCSIHVGLQRNHQRQFNRTSSQPNHRTNNQQASLILLACPYRFHPFIWLRWSWTAVATGNRA